ncbi:MAG: esterase [Flavobacteriaceae bacterium]|jgi:predicted alpha/beta superfamily hydrolase|nr:esterase [Flavobacteriaceae bacterium]MBT4113237.1 esterase [Flavobacteriaceae bacterium]MBT4614635.1 esterase [Flavobacteriaceae bacterium]MBT5247134.1 esterase [Flavobacteriaceae bacterium]MBT5649620.1 esterase [Flavobacteriaceae bacterium]
MNHKLLLILFFISSATLYSQETDSIRNNNIYDKIYSDKLSAEREITIQLPRDYNLEEEKRYPVFIVFDGDYLFKIVSGNVDYMSFWGDIPEAIVVGINQIDSRYNDTSIVDNINFTPISSTAKFFEFVSQELIPYINKNYRTTNFRVAVGHERTANFINFFLIKKVPIMNGYIAVSPKYTKKMKEYLAQYLISSSQNIYYYLSTSNEDFQSISEDVLDFNQRLDSLNNENIHYKFQNLAVPSHYTLPAYTIPYSIEDMFSIYKDINRIEYDSIILKLETSPVKYLEEKYEKIKNHFGVIKEISINDFIAVEQYIDEKEKFHFFKDLAKLATSKYRETILPSYYMGRFYEETGDAEKAMHIYRSAYNMEDIAGITKEHLLQKADEIADYYGY